MKCLKVLLIIFMFFYRTSEVESLAENFPNFQCFVSLSSCTIFDIDSTDGLQKIYDDLKNLHFEYETQSSSRECLLFSECNTIKNDFEDFKMLQFRDSHFEKFPSGDNKKLNHIRKLFAIDVGLTEIDRDDFEAFQSLKVLNLSHNSLEAIDGLFLIHLTSLTTLNLRNNFISKIDDLVLNENAKKLEFLDLSFNELTEISENLFDIFGKNSNAQLLLENNGIERIIPSTIAVNSSRKFKTLSLSGNKLKNFVYNCTSIDILSLDDNQLETFDISNCSVEVLNLQNNNLITIKVPPTVIFLSISNNMNLQSLTVNTEKLIILRMQNIPAKIVTFEMLQNATELETLDAFNTSLGPLKFDTFSNMESLNYLNLSKTELSHIDYGMFTHQKYIVTLDLSYNKLEFFDINIFSRMIYLETLYIHGNSLTEIEHIENIKSIISRLYVIKIHENHWNCTYLAKILKILDQRYIFVEHPENPVKNSPNVLGIGCKTKLQSRIQPISSDQGNETIFKKLNEIIEQINEEKTKRENHKFDADVMKSEIHNIQKEILDIKSTILTIQKDENQRQANSSNEFNAFKELIEHFKNITLEKEKKAHELATQNKGLKAFEFLLTIFITSFAVSSVFYAYNRMKKHLIVRINMLDGQRAQSTNTVNSTVELPISEMRF